MLRRTIAAAVSATAVATIVVLAAPTAAHAADRNRVETAHNTNTTKTLTASCTGGEVLVGAGARVIDGNGSVALVQMVPAATSVTAKAVALDSGAGAWSLAVAAVCRTAAMGTPQIAVSTAPSRTATCPAGTYLSGTGFDLRDAGPLTGLIPANGLTVTVRTSYTLVGGLGPLAYAVCVPAYSGWWMFTDVSAVGTGSPKTATATIGLDPNAYQITGVGGEVTVTGGILTLGGTVFIDGLMPNEDLTSATVEGVSRPIVVTGLLGRAHREGGSSTWSVTADALHPDYY